MLRYTAARMRWNLAYAALMTFGCGDSSQTIPSDAGPLSDANSLRDATTLTDAITAPLAWVDFAITGCTSGGTGRYADAGLVAPCMGAAPLTLEFHALAPAPIDIYVWDFGNDAGSRQSTPSHVYDRAGTYDVSLSVGAGNSTAEETKAGVVVVQTATVAESCTSDLHCANGLFCLCANDSSCAGVLSPGLCTVECDSNQPCASGVCAQLNPSGVPSPAGWQQRVCLAPCSEDSECGPLSCRTLRSGSNDDWISGCFSTSELRDVGEPCFDAQGIPDHAKCASGYCEAIGARGACSADCSTLACPMRTACATFNDDALGSLCVADCANFACTEDPWLACEPAGHAGPRGFTIAGLGTGEYCAPKACTTNPECGPDGTCQMGHCTAP